VAMDYSRTTVTKGSIFTDMSKVNFSFIIPAFNEEKLLAHTLESICDSAAVLTAKGLEWEVVVCDNNSTDQTPAIAKEYGARVVFEGKNQIARARNAGASIAKGDWFVFIDADSVPPPELFEDLVNTVSTGKIAGGGALMSVEGDLHWFYRFWIWMWNRTSLFMSWAAGSFVYSRADGFNAVGGFPEDCYTGEEIGLSRKLKCWAKKKDLEFRILKKCPLLTSSRKISLYSRAELLKTLILTLFLYPFVRNRRKAWFMWYDGRR
jgi:glycosyltransferase involved in cell wall biosynthesis